MVVSRGKENKEKSRNYLLATDENQHIYSYNKLVASQHWLTVSLPYLIHNMVASYFPNEITDYIFDLEKEADAYFKFNF